MTREPTTTILDAAIRTMFDERADRADDAGLRGDILSVTAAQPQARGWRLSLPAMFPPGLARVVILAILAVALGVASIVAFGAVSDEPVPTGPTTSFIRPFVYATPDDPTIRLTAGRREVVVWILGPDIPSAPNTTDPIGGSGAAGIVVGSAETAWSHGGPGRFMLRTAPAEFLADLRDTGGVEMGGFVETTLDGRPALTVLLSGKGGTDIHVNGNIGGLSSQFVGMGWPARLTVADVDGATIFVLIWARTASGLDAWLPVGDELVSSIRFARGDQP